MRNPEIVAPIEQALVEAGDKPPPGDAALARSRVRSTVFLSYSHDDDAAEWYTDVKQYLAQLAIGDELALWDDTSIEPGADWQARIEDQLNQAKAAVLLVTPTFLTSKFISGEEVPKLLRRQETEGLVVHALIAKPCDWQQHAIGDFLRSRQLSHSPDRSLEEMDGPERRRGLNELVKQIREDIGIYRHRNRDEHRNGCIVELENLLGVSVEKEIGGGDTSIVYRARWGQQEIAVKSMVSRPITDTGQIELRKEFRKCRAVKHPVFVRMFDLEFHRGHCVTTVDWVPGHKLSRWLTAAHRNENARRRWQRKATAILCKLASALAEAHANDLRYLNIHPTKILLQCDEPRIYPLDFSTYVTTSAHSLGMFAFPIDSVEYFAPEYITMAPARNDPLAMQREPEDGRERVSHKADQYSLGMVALAMLEGHAPVKVEALSDVTRLMRFHADPRAWAENGGQPLGDRQWRREMPGLARVIWRMLEPDPANRWKDMWEVQARLQTLLTADRSAPALDSDVKANYSQLLVDNDEFYTRFYARLFAVSPGVESKFGGVDMTGQRRMLAAAIERVLNFRSNQSEPTTLSAVARSHARMGLTAEQFDAFGQAFIDTLREEPAINRSSLDAWEAALWPAIEYLKRTAVKQASE